MSVLSDRMLRVLEQMRQKPDDVHLNEWLARDTGLKRAQVCEALNALHDRSLVEPGRRSVWRLSALGRHPGATYVSPPRAGTSGAGVANLDGTDDAMDECRRPARPRPRGRHLGMRRGRRPPGPPGPGRPAGPRQRLHRLLPAAGRRLNTG